jgi:ABC-type dipeptide/oligopeptide/nickel transport system permease subunit
MSADATLTAAPETVIAPASTGPGHARLAWRRLTRRPASLAGMLVVALFTVAAAGAPWLAPGDPLRTDWSQIRKAPSAAHLLGTDDLGRDVLARVVWGSRISMQAGVLSILLAMAIGVPAGFVAGYYRGAFDQLIMRLTDAWLSFPFLILAIGLVTILGPSLTNATLAIGLGATPLFIRLTRGQVLATEAHEYVQGARAMGAGDARVMLRHIFPNTLSPLIVVASLDLGANILAAAALSFIGLGAQPPTPEWGAMLSAGRDFMRDQWWIATFPGLAIVVTVLGLNLLGDGLRDALDPRGLE